MNQALLILKIAALLIAIFASGVWVGRNTTPAKVVETVVVTSDQQGSSGRLSPPGALVFQRYVEALNLTLDQQVLLMPIFREADEIVAKTPRFSPERQAILEKMHQQMLEHLNAKQRAEAEEIRKAGIRRMEANRE